MNRYYSHFEVLKSFNPNFTLEVLLFGNSLWGSETVLSEQDSVSRNDSASKDDF